MGRCREGGAHLEDLEIQGDIGRCGEGGGAHLEDLEIQGDIGRCGEGGGAHLEDLEVEHGGLAQDLLAEQERARLRLALLAALELLLWG